MKCRRCGVTAQVKLPSHHTGFCPDCFFNFFSRQVQKAIKDFAMFTPEDRILVCLSGGKDSLALMHQLGELGYNVTGLHVYLGIGQSSDKTLGVVQRFCDKFGFPLRVVSTPDEGLAIPDVKKAVRRPICAVCGRIKRYYFNKTAQEEGYTALCTGHNQDDETARLFANTLRWDRTFLRDQAPCLPAEGEFARKSKPLYRLGEFETACYSFLKGIDYHVDPCPYSPGATFTGHKELLAQLEQERPGAKYQFYDSFLKNARQVFQAFEEEEKVDMLECVKCGYTTPNEICGVCNLKDLMSRVREEAE